MAFKPKKAGVWTCSGCGWKPDANRGSDVLLPKPASCPKCGKTHFELPNAVIVSPAELQQKMEQKLRNYLEK